MNEIIIIGGGFPGLVAALSFASMQYRVKLFDVKDQLADSQLHAFKPIVLNAASWQLLSALELTQSLQAKAYGLRQMHVLRHAWSTFTCRADQKRHPHLGYVVMGADLQNHLAKAVDENPNITCFLGHPIDEIVAGEHPYIVYQQKQIKADLLIVADGRNSAQRQALNMPYVTADWGKKALVAAVKLKAPCPDAYLRFIDGGTIACIPTAHEVHQVIMTKNSEHAIFNQTKAEQQAYLNEALGDVVAIDELKQVMVFPLGEGVAQQVAIPGAILIGDAGFAIPPVGAQGLNLAFYDIASLLDLVVEAADQGMPLSSQQISDRHQASVKPHHDKLLKGVHALVQIFDVQSTWLQTLHGLSLRIANHLPPIKRQIAEFGMGFRYPMPHLIRGRLPVSYPRVPISEDTTHE